MLRRARGVLWRRTLRGVLISAEGEDEPMLVTSPGQVIWELLAEPCTRDELVAALAEVYGEDSETIRADVEPVLQALIDHGALIESSRES